jgi:hypothetical protein
MSAPNLPSSPCPATPVESWSGSLDAAAAAWTTAAESCDVTGQAEQGIAVARPTPRRTFAKLESVAKIYLT